MHGLYLRVRGWLEMHWFLVRLRGEYVLVLAGTGVAIVLWLLFPPVAIAAIVLTVASLILTIVLFIKATLAVRRQRSGLYRTRAHPSRFSSLRPTGRIPDARIIHLGDVWALYSPAVNRALPEARLGFSMRRDRFELPPTARHLAPYVLGEALAARGYAFNGSKVRLASDLTDRALTQNAVLHLQPTDYFASLCTNEIAGWRIKSREDDAILYDGFSLFVSGDIIHNLQTTYCCNHIGVSTMAITRDGYLVMTHQSAGAMQSPDLLAPSGSGSVDLRDWRRYHNEFLIDAMERELLEEVGLSHRRRAERKACIAGTKLVGFARLLNRGGKPDFFGVTFLKRTREQLGVRWAERPFIAKIYCRLLSGASARDFARDLQTLLEHEPHTHSFPLHLNLVFLHEYATSGCRWLDSMLAAVNE